LDKELLEEYVPVLTLITSNLINKPDWSLKLLTKVMDQLLPSILRQERDSSLDIVLAIEAAKKVLAYCPNEIDDLVALVHLLARAEMLQEATHWINQAIALEPSIAAHYRLRASLYERMGRYKAAYSNSKIAKTLDPDNLELVVDTKRILKKLIIYRLRLSWLM
jgi:tetratricopeptide (TPR) repeat protein